MSSRIYERLGQGLGCGGGPGLGAGREELWGEVIGGYKCSTGYGWSYARFVIMGRG